MPLLESPKSVFFWGGGGGAAVRMRGLSFAVVYNSDAPPCRIAGLHQLTHCSTAFHLMLCAARCGINK